jgi:hypothetical protein
MNAIGQHVIEVNQAVNLLKKCDYHIQTKKEHDLYMWNLWCRIIGLIIVLFIFAFLSGFSFCASNGV